MLRPKIVIALRAAVFLLLTLPALLSAQFVITNPGGNLGTSPLANDVLSCTNNDNQLQFRLTGSPGGVNPVFTIMLPASIDYVSGTVAVVSSNLVVTPTVGPNIGSANQPSFQVTGNFSAGDYVVVRLDRIADCDAAPGGGYQDAVSVVPSNTGAVFSNNYDVLAANLSVVASSPVNTSVGSTESVTGTITNGGNGCVEEFEFTVMDAPGLMTTSLMIG